MSLRINGGGERFVSREVVPLDMSDSVSISVPAGANMARIQPQLLGTTTNLLAVSRGDDAASLANNELIAQHLDTVVVEAPSGTSLQFALLDSAGDAALGGSTDQIAVSFFTNAGGRRNHDV